MADAPITNGRLAKIINTDVLLGFIGSAMVTAFVVGGAWKSQANDIDNLKQVQQQQSASAEALKTDIGKIKTDVEVIKTEVRNNREQYQRQLEEARRDREETDRKLNEILRRLPNESQ